LLRNITYPNELHPLFKPLIRPTSLTSTCRFLIAPRHYRSISIAKMSEQKVRVLIVGTGSVGTMSGYALEQGGKAEVTAAMRSTYEAVKANGVNIDYVQHGNGIRFRPINS
jgi:Ketopantoate reductase